MIQFFSGGEEGGGDLIKRNRQWGKRVGGGGIVKFSSMFLAILMTSIGV